MSFANFMREYCLIRSLLPKSENSCDTLGVVLTLSRFFEWSGVDESSNERRNDDEAKTGEEKEEDGE